MAPKIVAGSQSADATNRSLQASASCLANNGTYASCCPAQGVDPNDGVCTHLSCLEIKCRLSIRDGCSCYDIEKASDQLAMFATVVTALPDMCDMVGECCVDDGATITNVDWDFCMAEAQEAGVARRRLVHPRWSVSRSLTMTMPRPPTSLRPWL